MKNTVWLPVFALLVVACDKKEAESANVPVAVKDAFTASFQHTTDVEWEEENGNFEVDFKSGEQKKTALFSPDGKLIETETEIKPTELPVPVQATLESKYHGLEVKEAEKITRGSETRYEAEIAKGSQELEIILSEDGTIISEKAEDDKADKD